MWYPKADATRGKGFNELLITIIAASFILALLFCVFYYVVWHPKAKIKKMSSKTKLKPKGETISMIQLGGKEFNYKLSMTNFFRRQSSEQRDRVSNSSAIDANKIRPVHA